MVPDFDRFRLLRGLRDGGGRGLLGNTGTFDPQCAARFDGDGLVDQFARAVGARRAVRVKEFIEACEFFAAVRREVRAAVVADVCASHGLVGALFALFERSVERVVLIDKRVPDSRAAVLDAACEAGPWVRAKIEQRDGPLAQRGAELPPGAPVVAVHACGTLTDECIALALQLGGSVSLMPCCRPHRRSPAPPVLARELGPDIAYDVDRTYRLEQGGLTVRWDAIPASITPMNRVLVGWPCMESTPSRSARTGGSAHGCATPPTRAPRALIARTPSSTTFTPSPAQG
jgi:hypothetical protein